MTVAHALNVRSDFSIGESMLKVDTAVALAKERGYRSIAIVDNMTISGLVDLFAAAKKADIKPIIGVTLRVYDDLEARGKDVRKTNLEVRLKAYPLNEAGLKAIFKLLSKAYSKENFYYNARCGWDEILELPGDDVAITTGDFYNLFHHPQCYEKLELLKDHFPHLWVEIVPIDTPLYDTLNVRAFMAAWKLDVRPLASYPVLYPEGKADAVDVLRVIANKQKMADPWVSIPFVRDFEFREPNELARRVLTISKRKEIAPEFLQNAIKNVASFACMDFYSFEKKAPSLPKMADYEFAQLVDLCKVGFRQRLSDSVLGHKPDPAVDWPAYRERLKFELDVIRKMNFSGYFLLVGEIVAWAKANGIMVGPGRGSVGGSLVAYLIGITDVDPLRFNLLFERFINPDRVDLPDADLDFMSSRRHEVIGHIEDTYGVENVAGISNFSTLGPASAIRDVARVHGLDPLDYACSKQIEKEHGVSLSLEESLAKVPDIQKFAERFPHVWAHALSLEGVMRALGRHAAGVVVAGEPVANRAVVETRAETRVVNWDKRTVEDWGLIKMDILGLSTLDMLQKALIYIKERHKKDVNLLALPLDDPKTLEAFGRADTVGVFQFESAGMRKILRELAMGRNLTFDDLVATTALFRPGPLDAGLCEEYIQIKQGTKVPFYEHPNMEPALKPTYGVIIYQEQIMQICRDLAGFTITEADHVRKAMGKKDKEKMAEWKTRFIDGAKAVSGMSEFASSTLWEKIEVFAGYAFNKSHSVEYSILSWWSMWLKVNYPAEFYAAAMTVVDDDDKLAPLVMDARAKGIMVLPPDINESTDRIEIRGEKELLAPFQAVKGISATSAATVADLRKKEGGRFANKAHLEKALTANKLGAKCNTKSRERLELVGAFVSTDGGLPPLHPDRLRDRLELMPGFTVEMVKASRTIPHDAVVASKLTRLASDLDGCDGCSLKGGVHPRPRLGKTPKFMMVFDAPTWVEEKEGRMLEGDPALYLKAALKDAGLSANDGYYTALVKSPKPKGAKGLTNEQIIGCSKWLQQEIDALKPPIIVAMGGSAIRHFAPTVKGTPADLAGKVIFDPKLDASIVFGLNPGMVIFDPSKVTLLQNICAKIADLVT